MLTCPGRHGPSVIKNVPEVFHLDLAHIHVVLQLNKTAEHVAAQDTMVAGLHGATVSV